ncbi:LLM class flavin-dependent oxidoreductase [Rhodococcus sp. IEGM 1307]|jgi:alkanesulfonate monooxygenase|uniref:LLM class flavin-dependent oxidoreductase n=1 Tax=Rhodococcus sp. IEGM 1307 TaxID=3047091 RepID=UPI0024B75B2D|nr:LLM class flavin-dependent oxidoreductase [Rhodococcus sp. IEGM 1307]MDI9972205.1 LLM class flavin-dependent oxidoreductase [Rhodococcus sp. IEGM 1307]
MSTPTHEPELHFGWFIPTMGDTTAFGDPNARTAPSLELFERVAKSAEAAGFEYALVPVQTECYEAWIACAMVAARTERLTLLVAARPGVIAPTVAAKMISTFDQLSGGRVAINLIAGGSPTEAAADGLFHGHDERYRLMDETVEIMKRVWTEDEPVTYRGEHFAVEGAVVKPRPLQRPHPEFFLGGLSEAAVDVCAKHADVYLFWGDRPEMIAQKIAEARERAALYGREGELRFGMRLQVIVRDTEAEAWSAADALISGTEDQGWGGAWSDSNAQARMQELMQADDYRLGDHLWSGITKVRPGAGVAVVGNPQQVADTLSEFVDVGCTHFCLSGYPHDDEATRFGRDVMPLMRERAAVLSAG